MEVMATNEAPTRRIPGRRLRIPSMSFRLFKGTCLHYVICIPDEMIVIFRVGSCLIELIYDKFLSSVKYGLRKQTQPNYRHYHRDKHKFFSERKVFNRFIAHFIS